ncbi:MAG: hypothetical protein WC655_15840, partial [Candidatus Hydrogenedentales bacterium]
MRQTLLVVVCLGAVLATAGWAADPSVTIYNQNFAVVRQAIPLTLEKGVNKIAFNDTTTLLEPDSVMLRDPSGKWALQILEQSFRNDPVSQELLLSINEGQTIPFQTMLSNGTNSTVSGKIIRSGYIPQMIKARNMQQQQYYPQQSGAQPVIEVDGKIRFGLPGQPLFPSLGDGTILKPTLSWVLDSAQAGTLEAELGYVTSGMSWEASYNVVAPQSGDTVDIVGWITIENMSGKVFENAHIKLMAGNVSKIQPGAEMNRYMMADINNPAAGGYGGGRPVSEKAFDEYHLYTVARPATLRDRETKQIEFVRANGVTSERFYVYDGAKIDMNQYRGWNPQNFLQQQDYGTQMNTQVWTMRELKNTESNSLGMPLPAGRTRFYQRDEDGQLEFTGENVITHTPRDETLRVYTGDAFDLVGERKQTSFKIENQERWVDESFEIKLRNRKKEDAEIRVVEHLYRWHTAEVKESSDPYNKMDSQTIEFRV